MLCPYCKNQMTAGTLMGLRRLAWSENEVRKWALYEKEGEITLAESLNVAKIQAFRCNQCRKIIFDEETEKKN